MAALPSAHSGIPRKAEPELCAPIPRLARSVPPAYPARVTDPRRPEPAELAEWIRDFEAAARRTLEQRMRYAFIRMHKPVLDDEPFRAFDTMADYRRWCEEKLPSWLGYGRAV